MIVNGGIEAEETVKEYFEVAKCSYTDVSDDPDSEVVIKTVVSTGPHYVDAD